MKLHHPAMRKRRGAAMIAVLWLTIVAAMLALRLQKATRANLSLSHGRLEAVQARWLARAGVERAIAQLEDDDAADDSTDDNWYVNPNAFQDIDLGVGTYSVTAPPDDGSNTARYGLIDEASHVNVNAADVTQLFALPDMTPSRADSIIDWRDADDISQPSGAERGYYNQLRHPYNPRNNQFQTLRELLLVRDIDSVAFFGEDVNLNGLLDSNENDGDKSWPLDNADGELQQGLAAYCTVYAYEANTTADGEDRTNINSADAATLTREFKFTQPLANAVVQQRGRGQFASALDLLKVPAPAQAAPQSGNNRSGPNAGGSSSAQTEQVSQITVKWLAAHMDQMKINDDERVLGRINVNTASKPVLMTLPGMNEPTADAILSHRSGIGNTFADLGELVSSGTVSEDLFRQFGDKLTVRSSVFHITSTGRTIGGVRCTLSAVVDRSTHPISILYWQESN